MGEAGLSAYARDVIDTLGLERHEEGGWYRRTWQSATPVGGSGADGSVPGEAGLDLGERSTGARPLASLIYFLLPAGDVSAWHVVDADELWLWHGPGRVTLELGGTSTFPDEARAERVSLGMSADDPAQLRAQCVIPADTWQRTLPAAADALVSCVVSPGFVYSGFSLDAPTLPLVSADDSTGAGRSKAVESGRNGLTGQKAGIVAALTVSGEPLSSADIASPIGLGKTRTNELISELIDSGKVVDEGATRSRRYRLADD